MTDSRQLRDTFADPAARQYRTIVAVDVVNSTAMKEQQPEVNWLNSLGWLYDKVTDIALTAASDVVIKYNGDGIMLVFDTNRTTEAVNAAIRVQEAISKASTGASGGKGVIDFTCSIGISAGEVVGFSTPGGHFDVVGTVVDKAFRLCAAANAKAIFVDRSTMGAANMILINSTLGLAISPRRSPEQYQGDLQRTVLKGFHQPVEYYEILWDQQLYGVRSATVTASTDRLRPLPTMDPAPAPRAGSAGPKVERHRGTITCWRPEQGFGFVHDAHHGEDFHFTGKALVYAEDLAKLSLGREITFVVEGPGGDDRKRSARAVLLVGEAAEGRVVSLPADKPHGWIRVECGSADRHLVYSPINELSGVAVGDMVAFTVGGNDRGSCARDVARLEDEKAA